MINPINGHEVGTKRADLITKGREARANARRAMRSGNPARRAEAAKVYVAAPIYVAQLFIEDHRARFSR